MRLSLSWSERQYPAIHGRRADRSAAAVRPPLTSPVWIALEDEETVIRLE